jgi:hypothetical protein
VSNPLVSITFDNLGEAAQLELGMWPEDVPVGEHFTVLDVLPRLLDLLATHHMRATFFVEGLNAEMYPQALHTIVSAGHELAMHAYRHEEWAALDAESEVALLRRATEAMRRIDIQPLGFRPPGGGLTDRTLQLLGERGYTYVSPAGEREGLLEGLAVLPFRWPLVDAYSYLPQFAGLRERYGDGPDTLTPPRMRDAMIAALDAHAGYAGQAGQAAHVAQAAHAAQAAQAAQAAHVAQAAHAAQAAHVAQAAHAAHAGQAAHLTLLFHPFSVAFTGDPGWEALDSVLGHTTRLAATGALTAMRMDEAAARMLGLPEQPGPPALDDATWMTR